MEPGYPNLISYEFLTVKLSLSRMWLAAAPDHGPVDAEFVMARSGWRHRKLRARAGEFMLTSTPRRGWNHGDDVGEMVREVLERRDEGLGPSLATWVLGRIPIEEFRRPAVGERYPEALVYDFPGTRQFRLGAEVIAIEWEAGLPGEGQRTALHVVNLALS